MRKVLFYRDFVKFTGGHQKVFDYFNYVRQSPNFQAFICFSKGTVWNDSNPWLSVRNEALASFADIKPDILFLAGHDWSMIPGDFPRSIPIINFIQGIRHSYTDNRLYGFLKYKAIRICVSDQVHSAITKSKIVNGPVFTIPNALNLDGFPIPLRQEDRDIEILIVGAKNPQLAEEVHNRLMDRVKRIETLKTPLSRSYFLNLINRAHVTIFLPTKAEGFYLPALEGMALETIVVCPDCVGNRSFCLPGYNCFRPEYSPDALTEAARAAMGISELGRDLMLRNARTTINQHSVIHERESFLKILERIDELW